MLQTRIKNRLIRRGIVALALAGRWYRLAAEQGDASAQLNLGLMEDEREFGP